MDPLTLIYYALVCSVLSAFAPRLPTLPVRLAIGAAVGVIAAVLLPFVRGG